MSNRNTRKKRLTTPFGGAKNLQAHIDKVPFPKISLLLVLGGVFLLFVAVAMAGKHSSAQALALAGNTLILFAEISAVFGLCQGNSFFGAFTAFLSSTCAALGILFTGL